MSTNHDASYKTPVRLGWRQLFAVPASNRAEWLQQLINRYGHHLQLPWYLHHYRIHNEPMAIKHILLDNQSNYNKSLTDYNRARRALGNGLLTNYGPDWQGKRRILQAFFQPSRTETQQDVILDHCLAFCQRWQAIAQQNKAINLPRELAYLMLTLSGRLLFDVDLSPLADDIITWVNQLNDHVGRTLLYLPAWFPSPENRRYYRAKAKLREVCAEILQLDNTRQRPQTTLLSYIKQCKNHATGQALSQQEIFDEMLVFLVTGFETIALCLTWCCYALNQHPEVLQQLQQQVDHIAVPDLTMAFNQQRDNYCVAVIKESMRLYPPVWNLYRKCIDDDVVNGYFLPAGSSVMINLYALHRDPTYWHEADCFQPERFLSEHANYPKWAFIPFGGGKNTCIAQHAALRQAPLILACLVKHFQIELLPDQAIDFNCAISLRPSHGIYAQLRTR